ncbi:MAG: NAD/NADP octopine/nopaline dehydrogenase family protein [Planctomycetes bacterium]|nr:NAD/NADP octopine/nopaline dehydrogenase family protein [Planctomycetota bacterium]
MSKSFGIVGAGPAALSMACHLSLLGNRVAIYTPFKHEVDRLNSWGAVRSSGAIETVAKPAFVTGDIEQLVSFAEAIFVLVPAHCHRDVAVAMAPYVKPLQLVMLMPGRTGGSLEFMTLLGRQGVVAYPTIGEAQTVLHTCRMDFDRQLVRILAVKKTLMIATLPADRVSGAIEYLSPSFPQLSPAADTLITGLSNIGAILHPAPTLLNFARIEARMPFHYYREGITPSVARFLERLDEERCAVANALGATVPSIHQWLHDAYGTEPASLYEMLQVTEYYSTILGPTTVEHRYFLEDVPTGLVPLSELGKAVGVSTTRADMVIELAGKLLKRDFREDGRNLHVLGLIGKSKEEIVNTFRSGPSRTGI